MTYHLTFIRMSKIKKTVSLSSHNSIHTFKGLPIILFTFIPVHIHVLFEAFLIDCNILFSPTYESIHFPHAYQY